MSEPVHIAALNLFTCRERTRARTASRRQNKQTGRSRGRPLQRPAAYISKIGCLQPFDFGAIDRICTDCGAKHCKAELPSQCTLQNRFWMSCCKAGTAKVETLQELPVFLKTLLEEDNSKGRHFRDNIRSYNAAFAFTSLRCEASHGHVSYMTFQIHGALYHMQGPLMAENESNAALFINLIFVFLLQYTLPHVISIKYKEIRHMIHSILSAVGQGRFRYSRLEGARELLDRLQ